MKKGQRYQRIQPVIGDDEDNNNDDEGAIITHMPYHDEPSDHSEEEMGDGSGQGMGENDSAPLVVPLQKSPSTQSGSYHSSQGGSSSYDREHPHPSLRRDTNESNASLRMRRNVSPSPSRPGTQRRTISSRQGSFAERGGGQQHNNIVEIEGDLDATLGSNHGPSNFPSILRSKPDKDSNESGHSDSEREEDLEAGLGGGGSHGESAGGLFSGSHGSSFDLLDDDDEVDLQRYHLDFSSSPFGGTSGEHDHSHNMYHPRSNTNGTFSKDPWIRLENSQHSPTHGTASLSNIHSFNDFLLYLQTVRRQARQRRAQRLLTMPSEQLSERVQFFFMTYCWDATDVGLLVIAILLVVWFTGLLWLARMSARQERRSSEGNNESHNGAEYNGNAEFDDYSTKGNSWYLVFQWWWWGLGFVLLVRILGPFVVHNLNNRRRQRRRRRFESTNNMQQQQQRMQQQQSSSVPDDSDFIDPDYGNIRSSKADADESITGVEIPTKTSISSPAHSQASSASSVERLEVI